MKFLLDMGISVSSTRFLGLLGYDAIHLPSIITFRLIDMRPANVNHYLSETLARFAVELNTGALASVNERTIRVRLLPV